MVARGPLRAPWWCIVGQPLNKKVGTVKTLGQARSTIGAMKTLHVTVVFIFVGVIMGTLAETSPSVLLAVSAVKPESDEDSVCNTSSKSRNPGES